MVITVYCCLCSFVLLFWLLVLGLLVGVMVVVGLECICYLHGLGGLFICGFELIG